MLTLRDYAEGAWRFIAVCEGCGRESRVEPGEVLSGSARAHGGMALEVVEGAEEDGFAWPLRPAPSGPARRARRLPLSPIHRDAHRRRHGRAGVRPVYGAALRQPAGDGRRAHGRHLGGPRQRALRRGRGHEAAIRLRPAEPDAGGARGEPAPEEREGRRGVAAAGEPVLVRGPARARPKRYGAGTRTATGASPAARRARTASPRCGADTRLGASCATATGTVWCASEGADRRAWQETGRRRLMALALKLQVPLLSQQSQNNQP